MDGHGASSSNCSDHLFGGPLAVDIFNLKQCIWYRSQDCTFVLLSKARGERRVSARTFFVGYRSVGMEKDEVLVRIGEWIIT